MPLLLATLTLAGCLPEPSPPRDASPTMSREDAIRALRRAQHPLPEDLHGTWVPDLPLDVRQQHERLAAAAQGSSPGLDPASRWVAAQRTRDPEHPDLARLRDLPAQLAGLRLTFDATHLTQHRGSTSERATWKVHRTTPTHLVLELDAEGAPTRRLQVTFLGLDHLRLTPVPEDGTPTLRWRRAER